MTTWNELSARVGRNELPVILATAVLVDETLTDTEEIAKGIIHSWTMAEFPERRLTQDLWLMLFDHVGFLNNETPSAPPLEPVTLYRGAIPSRKAGMSWTAKREVAEWFVHRFDSIAPDGRLYQITVEPTALLARITTSGRGEDEWIVDILGLEHLIEEVQD